MSRNLKVAALRHGQTERKFYHRGSRADLGVIDQIFMSQDYALTPFRRAQELKDFYQALVAAGKPVFIVDAGANIGASTCWFALEYPQAEVIAFEPDPENFQLLRENCSGLRVDPRLAAVGSQAGKVKVYDPGIGEWGYRTEVDESGTTDLVSLPGLMADKAAQGAVPFIVKVDIEGAEGDLFLEPNDWVDQVPVLIVELHDWMLPKQRTALPFLQCVSKFDRDFVYRGENIFSIKNELPEA